MVTADHIGHGRFGLNVVSGWNPIEFGMMGVALGDHDGRYEGRAGFRARHLSIMHRSQRFRGSLRVVSRRQPRRLDAAFFTMNGVISVAFAVFVIADAVS